MDVVKFIDVTLRDGHQSLWSTRMTTAMMAPILRELDEVGFHTIDLVGGAVFDVCVRYLQENPWGRIRVVTETLSCTPVNVWTRGPSLFTFEFFPDDIVALTLECLRRNGVRHVTVYDALNDLRNVEPSVKVAHWLGLGITGALVYTVSPVHTDEFYHERARELASMRVDRVCVKDPSGLLTPARARTLLPAVISGCEGTPVEIHSHCLSGLAPQVYEEAMRCGVRYLHTAIPPLADGASLPPVEDIMVEAERLGIANNIRLERVRECERYFRWLAIRERKPVGVRPHYDPALYDHQVPGGMISNLRAQLEVAGISDRLEAILAEVGHVRRDLGYPIMVSPFAQFLITQATLNVVQGERYKTIPDELKKYALGYYGRPAAPLSEEFLDRVAGTGEKPIAERSGALMPPGIPRVRAAAGPFLRDEDLLLAAFYPQSSARSSLFNPLDRLTPADFTTTPLLELIRYLTNLSSARKVQIQVENVGLFVTLSSTRERMGDHDGMEARAVDGRNTRADLVG